MCSLRKCVICRTFISQLNYFVQFTIQSQFVFKFFPLKRCTCDRHDSNWITLADLCYLIFPQIFHRVAVFFFFFFFRTTSWTTWHAVVAHCHANDFCAIARRGRVPSTWSRARAWEKDPGMSTRLSNPFSPRIWVLAFSSLSSFSSAPRVFSSLCLPLSPLLGEENWDRSKISKEISRFLNLFQKNNLSDSRSVSSRKAWSLLFIFDACHWNARRLGVGGCSMRTSGSLPFLRIERHRIPSDFPIASDHRAWI